MCGAAQSVQYQHPHQEMSLWNTAAAPGSGQRCTVGYFRLYHYDHWLQLVVNIHTGLVFDQVVMFYNQAENDEMNKRDISVWKFGHVLSAANKLC